MQITSALNNAQPEIKAVNEKKHITKNTSKNVKNHETRIDANELLKQLTTRTDDLARHLLGEPNKKLSRATNLRYGAKGSLSINLKKGLWNNFETGEKGNLFHLIEIEKGLTSFKEVLNYASNFCNYRGDIPPVKQTESKTEDESKHENPMYKWAQKYYKTSLPVKGSPVEKYLLMHRHIQNFENADIRYCPSVYTKMENSKSKIQYLPALLAFSLNSKGNLNHIQVTRLNEKDCSKNKDCEITKQTFGTNNGFAVNLNRIGEGDTTYLTEGVETGLSIVETNPKARVYAVLGKENLTKINLNFISSKKVILCVDNDGEKTYKYNKEKTNIIIESMKRLEENGFDVWVSIPKLLPQKSKTDLNDILCVKGGEFLKKEINSLLNLNDFKQICEMENKEYNQKINIVNEYKFTKDDPFKNNINIKVHDEYTSKMLRNMELDSIKKHHTLENISKDDIKNMIRKNREIEREL